MSIFVLAWNISMVIWTQIFHNGKSNHGGDRKIFEVIMMTSTLPKVEVSRFKASNHALTLAPIILTVEQELLTLPEHPSSPPVFSGVRVT
jgi:hypothetical protein